MPISRVVLEDIQSRLQTLFNNQIRYLLVKDIDPARTGPPDLLSELRFRTLVDSLVVRFPAYHHHLVDMLAALFEPLQGDLLSSLGFSIDDALRLSEAVAALKDKCFSERRDRARRYNRDLRKAVKRYRQTRRVSGDFPLHVLEHLADMKPSESAREIETMSIAWLFLALGETLSFTAKDASEESGVDLERVVSLLDRLSLKFGDVEARYRLPAPTHPLMENAFINHDERFLCPIVDRICWCLKPAIEAL